MEHQTALNLIAHGYAPNSWLNWAARVDDLERLCRSYSEENATSCWEEITHAALVKFNYEPEKIFDFCNSAQLEQGAEACKRHAIGIMASEKNYDLQLLKNICTVKQPPNDPEFESDCYGLLVSNKLYSIPPKDAKDTVFFCSSIKPEFRSTCFNYLGAALAAQTSSIEEIEEICSTAPTDFKFQCNRKSRQKTEVQTKK